MEPNYSKIFNKKTIKSLNEYCELNNIEDTDGFIKKCFDSGFSIEKYGLLGETLNDSEKDLKTGGENEKQVIKEIIVEKRVEIPVEIIKEIVVEKEVIKEVPVEKIVTITNNEELEEKIFQLNNDLETERKIFSTKTEEMEIFFQKEMSKKDEELDELRRSLDISVDNLFSNEVSCSVALETSDDKSAAKDSSPEMRADSSADTTLSRLTISVDKSDAKEASPDTLAEASALTATSLL